MHFCTVLTFSLSLLIAYSSGFEYTYGKYRPIRRAFEDDLPRCVSGEMCIRSGRGVLRVIPGKGGAADLCDWPFA
ncbi:hypothetical protein Y032_0019g3846 [Ancylostoma ceylanicum]|uniref:Secreted protein n=1 Tax=Ancylostoma ceylanicum TaxID=53326 RepID=A0A016V431_9BILA|nr:hypothetical protein Y032_0019g3846 [Ancylostoma ceylanicum]